MSFHFALPLPPGNRNWRHAPLACSLGRDRWRKYVIDDSTRNKVRKQVGRFWNVERGVVHAVDARHEALEDLLWRDDLCTRHYMYVRRA